MAKSSDCILLKQNRKSTDQEICSKGIRDTILESSCTKDYSKTGDNIQKTGIVNRLGDYGNSGQRCHKKSGAKYTTHLIHFCYLT